MKENRFLRRFSAAPLLGAAQVRKEEVEMFTVGFLGAGHLAGALLDGWLDLGVLSPDAVCVYDPDASARAAVAAKGVAVAENEKDLVSSSRIVILAVRPSDVAGVIEKISDSVTFRNVLVSVAAGVPSRAIKKYLGKECKLIRAVPNIASRYGKGVTAMSYEMPITYGELQAVKDLFESFGILRVVEESRLNDYIAAASSSSAYIYAFVKAIADGAAAQGIDSETASAIATQVLLGASKVLESTGKSVDELLSEVATPNGTTAEALHSFETSGLSQTVADAMLACTKRADEMDAINEYAVESKNTNV